MAESPGDRDDAVSALPSTVREWLRRVADGSGRSEDELARALLSANGRGRTGDAEAADPAVTEEDLEQLEAEFWDLVEDVRERVLQVKQGADGKAPADHEHPGIESSVGDVASAIEDLSAAIDETDARLERGFDNYETVLTYLVERTDAIEGDLPTLAAAVLELHDRLDGLTPSKARRTALNHLARTANREGIRSAKCEQCGNGVDIGLLAEPECPYCETTLAAVEPGGFLRSAVLRTGTPPALEEAEEGPESTASLDRLSAMAEREEVPGSPDVPDAAQPMGQAAEPGAGSDRPDSGPAPAGDEGHTSPPSDAGDAPAPGDGATDGADDPDDGPSGPPASTGAPAGRDGSVDESNGERDRRQPGTAAPVRSAAEPRPSKEGVDWASIFDSCGSTGAEVGTATTDRPLGQTDGGGLQVVEGLSPADAGRLRQAGILDLAALAAAEPAEISERLETPEPRVRDWVERAERLVGR